MKMLFSGLCKNSRECLNDQICIQDTCRLTCNSNDTCPDSYFCSNRICIKEVQCNTNEDCLDDEECSTGKNGIPQCTKLCDHHPCGRNAVCISKSHQPICSCKDGFFGDPLQGCKKKECDKDDDCTEDKFCDSNMCKIACLAQNDCGDNSICSSEKHKHVCYCQPGYTGDPKTGCKEINWCEGNPCGNGAECKNTRNKAICVCPPETVGNPYDEGCHKAPECRFNRDCPAVARCTVIDGIRKCTGDYNK